MTRAPSDFPSTEPSSAPTKRECDGLDRDACALERCAYNEDTGECSPNCAILDGFYLEGDLVTDMPGGALIADATLLDCEYACLLLSEQCQFFYHAGTNCFLVESYTSNHCQNPQHGRFFRIIACLI